MLIFPIAWIILNQPGLCFWSTGAGFKNRLKAKGKPGTGTLTSHEITGQCSMWPFLMNLPPETNVFGPWRLVIVEPVWNLGPETHISALHCATFLQRSPLRNTVLHFWPAKPMASATDRNKPHWVSFIKRSFAQNLNQLQKRQSWCQMKSAANIFYAINKR